MSSFSNILKHLRNQHGYTQDELAKCLNISKSAISMYENGKREPDIDTLERFADFFNVDMNFLLGKTNYTTSVQRALPEQKSVRHDFSDDELLFLAIYKSLPVEAQNELKSYMKFKLESYENDPNLKDAEIEAGKIIEEFEKVDNTSNCG